MGRNLDEVLASGKFDVPLLGDEQLEEFETRVEWRLERLRRTDFDLLGEHAEYTQKILTEAAEDVLNPHR